MVGHKQQKASQAFRSFESPNKILVPRAESRFTLWFQSGVGAVRVSILREVLFEDDDNLGQRRTVTMKVKRVIRT